MLLVVELKIPNHFQHLNATWKSRSWKAGIGLVAVERLCSTGRIRAFLLNASALGHSYKTVTITSQLRRTCKALCQRARVETKKGLRGLVVSTGVYTGLTGRRRWSIKVACEERPFLLLPASALQHHLFLQGTKAYREGTAVSGQNPGQYISAICPGCREWGMEKMTHCHYTEHHHWHRVESVSEGNDEEWHIRKLMNTPKVAKKLSESIKLCSLGSAGQPTEVSCI